MPDAHLHFPKADTGAYRATWDGSVRCAVMQGGQGDAKHWAFNDPLPRQGRHQDAPPSPEEYRKLATRTVDLHPLTIARNARTPAVAATSRWSRRKRSASDPWKRGRRTRCRGHAGSHENRSGQRLTAFMISKRIIDSAVPMPLLADHPNVQFITSAAGLARARSRCIYTAVRSDGGGTSAVRLTAPLRK